MNVRQEPRETSSRAIEGDFALTPASVSRGRSSAPHLSLWLPIAGKAAAAAAAALVLAIIGVKAGAHGPPPALEPAPSATPPRLAAAFIGGLPAAASAVDGGNTDPPLTLDPAPSDSSSLPGGGLLADGRVVLNAASEAELTKLPGIGPSRARAILALRQRLTKFRAVEDLLRIKGIGRKMLRRLRPSVVLDRPAVDPRAAPAAPAVNSPPVEHSDSADS